jgi:flagellar biosynthesis protein FlhF
MKITRHAARDMRQALKLVRDQLGPDAVILSSRRTAGGVEVTAAMDFDGGEAAASRAAQPAPPAAGVAASAPTFAAPIASGLGPTASVSALESEIKTLRQMLEKQLAQFAWNDPARRAPVHTTLLRGLSEVGLARDLAAEVVAAVPAGLELMSARRLAIAGLAQRVLVTGDRWLEAGGRIALVGPTGVGKSTTIAKLAVRWVLLHGPRDLALVSGDSLRMGAHGALQALGQLLGAPVYPLEDFAALPELLARVGSRRMVLIDTPGSSQRDAQLAHRLAALASAGREIETALVIAASTQAGAVAETVARFAPASPTSCVLTKVDEAASLGGALSVLVRSRLAISYVSEGQRVPEDLRPARALELVSSAVQLAEASGATADEDLLKRGLGDVAHAFA